MHIPVLKNEVIQFLNPKPGENFIDCTLGFAGHTAAILQKNGPYGKVLGVEIDKDVCELAKRKIAEFSISQEPLASLAVIPSELSNYQFSSDRLMVVNDSYANLKEIVEKEKFQPINGILLDLGMSSWDLEQSGRGFSFQKDEPLDMRYAVQSAKCKVKSLTAQEIINKWPEEELAKIISEYGQERFAKNIAQKIVDIRCQQPIETTFQLIEVIRRSFPRSYKFGRQHFATKTFQALRIATNSELENLEKVLPQAMELLAPGGRLVIISFHSLEDRIVKNFFRGQQKQNNLQILTKKPIMAASAEARDNPKARSAKLRAVMVNCKLSF